LFGCWLLLDHLSQTVEEKIAGRNEPLASAPAPAKSPVEEPPGQPGEDKPSSLAQPEPAPQQSALPPPPVGESADRHLGPEEPATPEEGVPDAVAKATAPEVVATPNSEEPVAPTGPGAENPASLAPAEAPVAAEPPLEQTAYDEAPESPRHAITLSEQEAPSAALLPHAITPDASSLKGDTKPAATPAKSSLETMTPEAAAPVAVPLPTRRPNGPDYPVTKKNESNKKRFVASKGASLAESKTAPAPSGSNPSELLAGGVQ
jgi:hypothetical protein